MNKTQNYINHNNITLLDSLISFKKDLSKKTIKNYLKNKMITVNHNIITNGSYLLKDNDLIEISYTKKIIPDYNLEILYENIVRTITSIDDSKDNLDAEIKKQNEIYKLEEEIGKLESKIRNEKQFNIKVQYNEQINHIKRKLNEINDKRKN